MIIFLLTSAILHIQDKKRLNKEIKNHKIKIITCYVKQKLIEVKDDSEIKYEEQYVVLDNNDKIIFKEDCYDLLQKGDLIYAVYTYNETKLLKIYPEFKYNIL